MFHPIGISLPQKVPPTSSRFQSGNTILVFPFISDEKGYRHAPQVPTELLVLEKHETVVDNVRVQIRQTWVNLAKPVRAMCSWGSHLMSVKLQFSHL